MIDVQTIQKLAELARLKISAAEADFYIQQLNDILTLEEKLKTFDTDVAPLFHSIETPEHWREDCVTETDQRALMQSIAPKSLAGLYLVPKVIE
jgi:aspartyl-tRNA(Asn)/glutamyl-tRNA(Gln) amidotransferase subunit C